MKTMQEEWEEYRRMEYPSQISATLISEAQRAFMAGALVASRRCQSFQKLPGNVEAKTDALVREIVEFGMAQLQPRKNWGN